MVVRIVVITGYFAVLLGIGWAAKRRALGTSSDYFLASRTLHPLVLFLTMAATNFSAFTVFGFSGAGWESGYSFYPVMAFGTGFMALSFVLIGVPVWRLGAEHGLMTPPEAVARLTGSRILRILFFLVMTAFTLPYLAMQPMAAGYALESLLGIPYFGGAALMTGIILLYTFLGGFRGVTWTDVFQGGMLISLLLLAVALIAGRHGGLTSANHAVADQFPALFSRPGLHAIYSPGIWFGYMLLWFLCDPMFPQLFQRFYAARDARSLGTTMWMYPLLTGGLFLLPVTLGVLGRLTYPHLPAGTAPDRILPLLLHQHTPPVVEALVLTAALAALMSTLDSQLLTLSSMFARDIARPLLPRLASRVGLGEKRAEALLGKGFVVILALTGLVLAKNPPATFRVLATQTFTGLAVLFPTVAAALYWKRMTAMGAIASIAVGEGLVAAYSLGWLPTFGTLAVVPVVGISTLVLVLVSRITRPDARRNAPGLGGCLTRRQKVGWTVLFALLFFAGHDVWNWGDARLWLLGLPWWVWMFLGLCAITSVLFRSFSRHVLGSHSRKRQGEPAAGFDPTTGTRW